MLDERRILAIDYGERRIGLAISDPLGIIASGLGTWENSPLLISQIEELVTRHSIIRIIVGMPLTLKGESGKSAQAVQAFIEKLGEAISIPIEPVDERFTSVLAEQTIRALGVGRKKRKEKAKVDEIAAVHLLQGYLDFRRTL